jgi:hypothetical protein
MSRGSRDERRLARLRLQLAAARVDDGLVRAVTGPTVGLAALAGLVAGLLPGDALVALSRGFLAALGSGPLAGSRGSTDAGLHERRPAA